MKRFSLTWLNNLRANDFIRHNAIMFIGSMIAAGINSLYYPVVGRLVSTNQFGEVQVIISLFLQITLVLGVVADVTVNIVANAKDIQSRNEIVYELERLVTLLMAAIVIISFIFIGPIDNFLHIKSGWPIFILGISLILGALASQRSAFLRGIRSFGKLSISQFIGSLGKLIASLILVLAGFATNGAIGGLMIAQLLTLIYLWHTTRRAGLTADKNKCWLRLPSLKIVRPELPFTALVLIVSIVTTVLFSIDVVIIKHFFSAKIAGEYAGIATIARIIYFLTGSVAIVLLSAIKLNVPMLINRRLFIRSLILTMILGGLALVVVMVEPRLVIKLLIGKRYLPLAGLLPRLSFTLFMISIVNLVFSYDVALRRWSIAIISIIGTVATSIFIVIHHTSPEQVVSSLLAGTLLLLALRVIDSLRRNVLHLSFNKPKQ
jgi:O-antigen/teichoic acid export membrane protein